MSARRNAVAAALVLVACAGGERTLPAGTGAASPAAAAGGAEQFRPLAVGDTAPALALRTLTGQPVALGAGGPLTLVNVWATWCTSCSEEMADLEALHREFAPRGLRVLAVSVDEGDGTRVRRFVASQRLTMPVAHDPSGAVQDRYQVMAVPETYLIGPDGRLLWRQAGGLHGAPEVARRAVLAALRPGG